MGKTVIDVVEVNKSFIVNRDKNNTIRGVVAGLSSKKVSTKNEQIALRDISFKVNKGDFFGIVGRNGSGKSTLLKIIAGIYKPTSGDIHVKGSLVPFIELGVGFNPELSAKENVYLNGAMLGFSRSQVDTFYDTVVEFAELKHHMEKKLKNFSSGMQVRLAFSIAIQADADILLIDEVLAVGDASFKKKCYDFFEELKDNDKTVIFVTHDMGAVAKYCNKALLIDKNKIIACGNPVVVGQEYKDLFIDKPLPKGFVRASKKSQRRGNKRVRIVECNTSKEAFKLKDDIVGISAKLEIEDSVRDNISIGFLVKNTSGESVLGTNTNIENVVVKTLEAGQNIMVEWQVPNIFGKGKYIVDVAATSIDGAVIYDWWSGSASFRVDRIKSTPYSVSPRVPTKITYKQ